MSIDVKSLSRIIKVCVQNGVSRFKCGDFDIEFGEQHQRKSRKGSDKKSAQIEKDSIASEETKIKAVQVENLLLEDPETYERLMLQGELDAEDDDRQTESTL